MPPAAPPIPVAARAAVAAASASAAEPRRSKVLPSGQSQLEPHVDAAQHSLEELDESAIDRAAIAVLSCRPWTTVS